MTTQATLTYTAYLAGLDDASAASLLGGVPLPEPLLAFYGLRVISDSTPTASPVVRTIVLGFNPVSSATAAAVLEDTGASASPLKGITVSAAGIGYVVPPVVSITGGRPAGVAPGMLQPTANGEPRAVAYLKVVSAAVVAGGSSYTATTKVVVSGALKASGSPPPPSEGGPAPNDEGMAAVLTPTIVGGVITGIAVTSAGSGYTGVPTITVVDSGGGSGAEISVSMGVGEVVLLNPGGGFDAVPTVTLTPFFQFAFPPASDQKAPLKNLFNVIFEQALLSPVSAGDPVIA